MRWLILLAITSLVGCSRPVSSVSGVPVAKIGEIHMDSEGHTIEQRNIIDRLKRDNDPGAVKHLYVISAYSGQVLIYSPVRGKVTSGGKSLSPRKIIGTGPDLPVMPIGDRNYYVDELPNEDGTFGSSSHDYLYWFTPDGRYHQHYLSGGQIVHIADQPLNVKGVVITIESK